MKVSGSFSAMAVWMLLSSSSTASAFQAPSPLTSVPQRHASTESSTCLSSSVFDTGVTRVPGRRYYNGSGRRGGYSVSDENYDYRRGGRGSEYRRGRNAWDVGYANHRRRERERVMNDRWEPRHYNYRDSYWGDNYGRRSWYDDTSFSGYDRYRGYRDSGHRRWNPRQKDRWYDKTTDIYGAPTVQGGTRKTFSKRGGYYDDSQSVLELGTDGRPLYANVETWEGPDNTRASLNFYSQDGLDYGVRVLSGNRHGNWHDETTSVRNTGPMEYPMKARVDSVRNTEYFDSYGSGSSYGRSRRRSDPYIRESGGDAFRYGTGSSYGRSGRSTSFYGSGYGEYASSSYSPASGANSKTIQGGATRHWQLSPNVESIRVELHSQGLPIMARIELLQGPNNVMTLGEVYQEDGFDRPFVCVLDTGDSEWQYNKGTLQITNDGPMEFPITAVVEAHELVPYY